MEEITSKVTIGDKIYEMKQFRFSRGEGSEAAYLGDLEAYQKLVFLSGEVPKLRGRGSEGIVFDDNFIMGDEE